MAQIKQGTVTVTNGSATVTGSGTNWLDNVEPGDFFIVQNSTGIVGRNVVYQITGVASNTSMTISPAWEGQGASGVAYVIYVDFLKPGYAKLLPGDLESAPIYNKTTQNLLNLFLSLGDITLQGTVGMYPTVGDGESGTSNGDYFWVASGSPAELSLYRNVGGSGTLIGTWPLLENIQDQLDAALATLQAQQDAFQAAHVRLSRSLSAEPDRGETLRSDSIRDGHGLGTVLEGGMTQALAFDELWAVARNGPKTYVAADGLIRTAAANELPVSYDPVTLRPVGRVVEEQRTNILKNSGSILGAGWGASRSTRATTSVPSPVIGDPNFVELIADDGVNDNYVEQSIPNTGAGSWSVTAIIRPGENLTACQVRPIHVGESEGSDSSCVVDLTSSEIISTNRRITAATALKLVDGSTLVKVLFTTTSAATSIRHRINLYSSSSTVGNGGDSILIAANQLEEGLTPTSYIPTEGAAVTRLSDSMLRNSVPEISLAGMTVFCEFTMPEASGFTQVVAGYNGGLSVERFVIDISGPGSIIARHVENSDGTQDRQLSLLAAPAPTPGQVYKAAISIDGSQLRGCVNGGSVASTSIRRNALLTESRLAGRNSDSDKPAQITIKDYRAVPFSSTPAELQELTTP